MSANLCFILLFFLIPLLHFCQNANVMNERNYASEIQLPPPSYKGSMSVEEALLKRRSIRSFTNQPLTLQQVSQLLWSAYGVTKLSTASGRSYKTAPSAGATYPLEIYLMAGNVIDLPQGIYKYNPEKHTLRLHKTGDLRQQITDASLGQNMLTQAPITIIYAAVYERTTSRYGNRGKERYVPMDVGHSAQNVYLQATAMGLGTCAVGAFHDKELQKVLEFPQPEEVIYLMPVGYPK